jgi:hypothetical protein
MKKLNKEDIFGIEDLTRKEVDMSNWWGGSVYIQSASVDDVFSLTKGAKDISELEIQLRLICACVVDENGNKMFSENDIPKLRKKNQNAIKHLAAECYKYNKFGEVRDLEEEAKNL